MFNERKVAQMAAYLLEQGGRRMPHLKLMKLLYLADRKSMELYGMPISGDRIVAMPHGPVLSMTLNLSNGDVESSAGGWESLISDREGHEISLRCAGAITRDDLDELSLADIKVLESVWDQFGHMTRWEIRDYTHVHCPEWKDPEGSSFPISYEKIFRALGKSEKLARELSARIRTERSLDSIFASL
jgi:uncharacterized phage-associated protein